MAKGPTLTGVAILALLIVAAGFAARELRAHHKPDAALHAPVGGRSPT